jgi:hypothetical protein
MIRGGQTSIGHFAIAGVVLGNLPFAVCLLAAVTATLGHLAAGTLADHLAPATALLAGGLRVVSIGSVVGGVCGVPFWLIAVTHRPSP